MRFRFNATIMSDSHPLAVICSVCITACLDICTGICLDFMSMSAHVSRVYYTGRIAKMTDYFQDNHAPNIYVLVAVVAPAMEMVGLSTTTYEAAMISTSVGCSLLHLISLRANLQCRGLAHECGSTNLFLLCIVYDNGKISSDYVYHHTDEDPRIRCMC
jgi:hypothetical protein